MFYTIFAFIRVGRTSFMEIRRIDIVMRRGLWGFVEKDARIPGQRLVSGMIRSNVWSGTGLRHDIISNLWSPLWYANTAPIPRGGRFVEYAKTDPWSVIYSVLICNDNVMSRCSLLRDSIRLRYWNRIPGKPSLAAQGVCGSNPGLATKISEIGYLLLPSRDMAEKKFNQR